MRLETFTVLYKACDHIADESLRLKILDWARARAKMVILEASEDLREHLLAEMELLFTDLPAKVPPETDESAREEA